MTGEKLEFDARLFTEIGKPVDIRDFLKVQAYAYKLACAYVDARRELNSDAAIVAIVKKKHLAHEALKIRAVIFSIASEMLLPSYMSRHDRAWFEDALGVATVYNRVEKEEKLATALNQRRENAVEIARTPLEVQFANICTGDVNEELEALKQEVLRFTKPKPLGEDFELVALKRQIDGLS